MRSTPENHAYRESLLAGMALSRFRINKELYIDNSYCKALKSGGVISGTWEHVQCADADGDMQLKLQLVKRCFIDRDVIACDLIGLVLYRYIGGLRKLTKYDILRKTGHSPDECMELVEGFPF